MNIIKNDVTIEWDDRNNIVFGKMYSIISEEIGDKIVNQTEDLKNQYAPKLCWRET